MNTGILPERIQLRRARGWRKPAGVVVVARPGRWGNPFVVVPPSAVLTGHPERWYVVGPDANIHATAPDRLQAQAAAVDLYRTALTTAQPVHLPDPWLVHDLGELRGRDLACWCRPGDPCHADVLLELANLPTLALLDLDETATAAALAATTPGARR